MARVRTALLDTATTAEVTARELAAVTGSVTEAVVAETIVRHRGNCRDRLGDRSFAVEDTQSKESDIGEQQ